MFLDPLEEQREPARLGQVACHQYTPALVGLKPSYHFLEKRSRRVHVKGVPNIPGKGERVDSPRLNVRTRRDEDWKPRRVPSGKEIHL